eukprot:m.227032 g.227032  ORF g.227032 m.227032 type:complete len:403 (+) comp25935_c1_seq16:7176-8384(+)
MPPGMIAYRKLVNHIQMAGDRKGGPSLMSYAKIFNERARAAFPNDPIARADEAIKIFDATPGDERDVLWKRAQNVPRYPHRRRKKKGDKMKAIENLVDGMPEGWVERQEKKKLWVRRPKKEVKKAIDSSSEDEVPGHGDTDAAPAPPPVVEPESVPSWVQIGAVVRVAGDYTDDLQYAGLEGKIDRVELDDDGLEIGIEFDNDDGGVYFKLTDILPTVDPVEGDVGGVPPWLIRGAVVLVKTNAARNPRLNGKRAIVQGCVITAEQRRVFVDLEDGCFRMLELDDVLPIEQMQAELTEVVATADVITKAEAFDKMAAEHPELIEQLLNAIKVDEPAAAAPPPVVEDDVLGPCAKCDAVLHESEYDPSTEVWVECVSDGWFCPKHSPTHNCGTPGCPACNPTD